MVKKNRFKKKINQVFNIFWKMKYNYFFSFMRDIFKIKIIKKIFRNFFLL